MRRREGEEEREARGGGGKNHLDYWITVDFVWVKKGGEGSLSPATISH